MEENSVGGVVSVPNSPEDELSPSQHRALRALLSTTTIAAAAEEAGLGLTTIKRYLTDENFARIYREQRSLILQETVAGLQQTGNEAISVLRSSMSSEQGDPNLNLRAARTVLDFLFKGVEIERRIREQEELEERIEALEAALDIG